MREAARDEHWRPGRFGPDSQIWKNDFDFQGTRVQTALERARRKTFVSLPKPFRRLMRNQGAVNDSLLEALHHLALQNAELSQELGGLRDELRNLRTELRLEARQETGVSEIMNQTNPGEEPLA